MFTPSLVGQLFRATGRDIHGQVTLAGPVACQFSVVNAKRMAEKTSVVFGPSPQMKVW